MDQHSEVMIFTFEMALDLQRVLPQILATHIVLQMAIAMEAAIQGHF